MACSSPCKGFFQRLLRMCGILLAGDPLYGAYLSEHAAKLRRSAEGLRRSNAPDAAAQAARIDALTEELERKRCKG